MKTNRTQIGPGYVDRLELAHGGCVERRQISRVCLYWPLKMGECREGSCVFQSSRQKLLRPGDPDIKLRSFSNTV